MRDDDISNTSTAVFRDDHKVALIEWKKLAQTSITISEDTAGGTAERKGLVGDIFVLADWPSNSITVPMPTGMTWKWKYKKGSSKIASQLVLLDTNKQTAASYLLTAPEEKHPSTILEIESTLTPPTLDYVVISWVIMTHHIENQQAASKRYTWRSGIPAAFNTFIMAIHGGYR
ncbi:hypothetical protein DL93DRAFT_2227303 [Clavulina sp. PMI_390]|nr:hypothetical protein DL93DRAFT_2227303 [Clavulina sp. PMI_390]